MAKVVPFANRGEAREQAAAWIARMDNGLSAEDENELRGWLREHAHNRDALIELAALWDEADRLGELADLFPLDEAGARRGARPGPRWAYAAAAVLVLTAAAVLVTKRVTGPAQPVGAPATFASDYLTPVGTRSTEHLPDESSVRLNTDTNLSVDYTSAERNVFLHRGEAYFDVAHEADRPFKVHVDGRVVEAVGTEFNVRLAGDGEIRVTVTAGRIRLANADVSPGRGARAAVEQRMPSAMLVEQGELATVAAARERAGPQVRRLQPAEIDAKLAWQRGMLVFRGESLATMLDEVGRYTTTDFVLADDELANVRVGGYFPVGDVDSLLVALRQNFDIEADRPSADRIVLRTAD